LSQSGFNKSQFSLKLSNRYDVLHDYDEEENNIVKRRWQGFEMTYKEMAEELLDYR